ncbi:hypothetical protein IV102_35210 [bacterium]|nr:hypothetical protein [bacterium]
MHILNPADGLRLWQFFCHLSGRPSRLPGQSQMGEMVDFSFWASLEKEEARAVRFSLVYETDPQPHGSGRMFLDEPLEFSAHNIIKLAPAVVFGQRALGVTAGTQGSLWIWGTLDLPTQALTLESSDPGQLRFRFLDRTRVVFHSGRMIYLANDNSDNLLLLVNAVSQYEMEITPSFLLLSEALEKVIQSMLEHGHGGTLLWIPEGHEWSAGVKSIRYRCQPPYTGLRQAVQRLYPHGPPDFSHESNNYRADPAYEELSMRLHSIQSAIDSVGQLTAVDGATVLNEELHVLAFGIMLRAQADDAQDTARVLELGQASQPDARLSRLPERPLARLGGARHRSAAEFCVRYKESLAFVASQDGSLTIFGSGCQSGQLFAIRRAELALQ